MKILKNIINITILVVLTLYLIIVFALRIDGVQQLIGNQVARQLSATLGTKIEIGEVDLGFLNRIILDDVKLYDQQGKEMLTAARLTAKINLAALAEQKIEILSAQIFSAHFNLYRQSAHLKHNFQFVLDSLSSGDNKENTPLNLRINSLIVRHSSVSYNLYDKIKTPTRLNPAHLAVTDINSHIILKKFTNDSINVNIKKLSLKEQSGLVLERMSLTLEAGRNSAVLNNFCMKLPGTKIELDRVAATYHTDNGLHIKGGTARYTLTMQPSRITLSDFAFLEPKLKKLDQTLHINAHATGTDTRSTFEYLNINTPNEEIVINTKAQIEHRKGRKPAIDLNLRKIEIAPDAADKIVSAITDKHIPETIMRLGTVRIDGNVHTDADTKAATNINIRTAAGVANIDARLSAQDNITGKLTTNNFDLGYILNSKKTGAIATSINVDGNIQDHSNPTAQFKGIIEHIEYNTHIYRDINLDIKYNSKNINGEISIDNPNIALNISGSLDKTQGNSRITLNGHIINLAPKSLNITDKYGNANFTADISADITGNNINDVCGTLDVTDFKMVSETDYYHLHNFNVTSGYDNGHHYMSLTSDFGNIELSGHYDYASLPASFVKILKKHMPTMPGLPQTKTSDNDFSISATLTKSDWMNKLFGVDLVLIEPLRLTGNVSDRNNGITLNLNGESFEYNGKQYGKSLLNIISTNENMNANASITQANSNGRNITYYIDATAADNRLTTNLSWKNNGTGNKEKSGNFKAVSQFYTGNGGERTADIRIEKSHININGARWDVAPSDIRYYKNMLAVHNFSIRHNDQHLTINGKASKYPYDSLIVDLKDVDVEYVLDLVNFHSVNFNGMASGKAYIMSPFDKMEANANLKVRDFKFEHGRMGTLNAAVEWNNDEKQIDIHGICNDGPDAMTFVDGYVSPKRNYIDLDINAAGTYIDFMQSFTHSFAEGFTGRANGKVKLSGPLSTINLTGMLVVDGEAKIKALNCKYYLKNDTVRLIPNEIELRDAIIHDIHGNSGYVNGFIHHKHLTRLSYDLNVKANNLLSYDFKEFNGSTFCGTVYADGSVDISGKSGELTIDVNCTPRKNSVFAYDTSSPDAITNQEFIKWNDITPVDTMTANAAKSRTSSEDEHDSMASDIYINFLINCRPEATLRLLMDNQTNDYITLNGSGVLRASYYNKGAFKMFGTYLIDHGTYSITIQNIIKKYFVFNRGGTIVFGGDPYDAALNMQAVYTVNGVSLSDLSTSTALSQKSTTRVNCLMNIGGQPKQPQVTFDLDMPTMDADEKQMVNALINTEEEKNQQVLYLLGIGRFYPQAENNSDAEQTSRTSLAMQSILSGTISGQINNLLNTVLKSENWNFGANISTGDEGWNNAEYEGIVNGRMLNDRLLFNGEFGYRDNAATANTSFIGDFNIQYNLTPNGNLSIKVYNETNDRYFTKSSLNTQGVGFVVKRDFTSWRDLWSTGRKKRKEKQ